MEARIFVSTQPLHAVLCYACYFCISPLHKAMKRSKCPFPQTQKSCGDG